jgi:hypothetical protein
MAKKPKDSLLELPVSYGNVSFGDHTATVGCKVSRGSLSIVQADKNFTGKRLTGSILARPEGAGPEQGGMFGADGDLHVEGIFDCGGFAVKPKNITFSIGFNLDDVDRATLSQFAKRNGLLTITQVSKLEDDKKDEDSGDE